MKIVKIVFICLFIFFLSLYFATMNGYYNKSYEKTVLTNEAIDRFESDVKKGKRIDASNYVKEEIDYSNKASNIGMKLSKITESIFQKVLRGIVNVISNSINN